MLEGGEMEEENLERREASEEGNASLAGGECYGETVWGRYGTSHLYA